MRSVVMALGVLVLTGSVIAGSVNPAADMMAAKAGGCGAIRESVIAAAPAGVKDRDDFAKALAEQFKKAWPTLTAEAKLQTAMLMAQLECLSCDQFLMERLKDSDPAVRYWAAKGLTSISTWVKRAGSRTVVTALRAAKDKETDDVVTKALDAALGAY